MFGLGSGVSIKLHSCNALCKVCRGVPLSLGGNTKIIRRKILFTEKCCIVFLVTFQYYQEEVGTAGTSVIYISLQQNFSLIF